MSLIVADLPEDLARLVKNWVPLPVAIKTAINALLDVTLPKSREV